MNNKEAIAKIKGMRFQVQSSLDEIEVDVDSKEAEQDNQEIVEAFDMAIKALEQTEWIPVSSGKMPISYVAVEVTVIRKDKTWNQTPYIRLAEWHEGLKDWFEIPYPIDQPFGERLSESDGGDATVVAWRPLGEPYKEEKE